MAVATAATDPRTERTYQQGIRGNTGRLEGQGWDKRYSLKAANRCSLTRQPWASTASNPRAHRTSGANAAAAHAKPHTLNRNSITSPSATM